MIDVATIAEIVNARSPMPHGIRLSWLRVDGNRDQYAVELRRILDDRRAVVLVLRQSLFDNPNAVGADFVALVEENRLHFSDIDPVYAQEQGLEVVLLARTHFRITQGSSPAVLPPWFPVKSGQEASVEVEELTWLASAPLNGSDASIDSLCELLFELEGLLLERISMVRDRNHTAVSPFLEVIRDSGETLGVAEILTAARAHRETVTTPRAFRPSLKQRRSLLARLWSVVGRTGPEKLGNASRALASALAFETIGESPQHMSLIAVIGRPTTADVDAGSRWARSVLLCLAAACQLATAAAHADAYPHFPVLLLRSVSYELRLALSDACRLLRPERG